MKFKSISVILIMSILVMNQDHSVWASSSNAIQHQTQTIVVSNSSKAKFVAAGQNHTCVITDTNGVQCWGENSNGELGDGTKDQNSTPVDVLGLSSNVVSIAAGGSYNCALTSGGGVKCWGSNFYGELGNNSTQQSSIPVNVYGLQSGVTKITAKGENFAARSCALTSSGGVKCWGRGPLGDGTSNNSSIPVDVQGLQSGNQDVQAGHEFACALTGVGGVKCWGMNYDGELGNGTFTDSTVPVDVSGLTTGVVKIAVGSYHACALTNKGIIKCWGSDSSGELGDGTTVQVSPYGKSTPTTVVMWPVSKDETSTITNIAAGNGRTCAAVHFARTDGLSNTYAKCWGSNGSGGLGDGTTISRSTPTTVVGIEQVSMISVGTSHTCAVTSNGGVLCWGSDSRGQLGVGTVVQRTTPMDVSGLVSGVAQISTGIYTTCAVTTGGGVKCWGLYALGNGSFDPSSVPVDVLGLSSGVKQVAVGYLFACALTTGGGVKCWGQNAAGSLGDGTNTDSNTPVDVNGLTSGVKSISATNGHVCALTTSGAVKCWGNNYYGQLGNQTNTNSSFPVPVFGLGSGVIAIAAGSQHTCALTSAGGMKCWGFNLLGELGNATTTSTNYPVDVTGLTSGVKSIAAGGLTCAILNTNGLKCWGNNSLGGVGNGTNNNAYWLPQDVGGLSGGVMSVTIGAYHTCALITNGHELCWGGNYLGQIGNGTLVNNSVPGNVRGLDQGVSQVASGWEYSCALTSFGGVKCWGSDNYGQLGQGIVTQRTVPVNVIGFGGNAYSISGHVQDNSNTPMSGVYVMAGPSGFTSTDSNGDYGLLFPINLSSGNYSISASFPGYTFSPNLNVTLPPPATNQNFTGIAGNVDITPPIGYIQKPNEGDLITSNGVDVIANALDDAGGSGVNRVDFYAKFDGKWHLVGTSTTAPYQVHWTPTADLRTQLVTFSVFIYDNAGNVTRNSGGFTQVSFVKDGQNIIPNRAYLNQRALGDDGDYMCSMASIAMILASAGNIHSDFDSLRNAATLAHQTLDAPGAEAVMNYLNQLPIGMSASVIWSQNKNTQWTEIVNEINAGRPLILSNPPQTTNPSGGGSVTTGGHYMVIVGYIDVESTTPVTRQIIVYDPYGIWLGTVNSYDRNSTSPDPPEGVKGRQVIYNWSSFGTTYLIEAHSVLQTAVLTASISKPDEVFVLDTQDIVNYQGDGERLYPVQRFLPSIMR